MPMRSMIKLLADKNIMLEENHLPESVTLKQYDPTLGIPSDAGSYDALFIRTVTPIGENTIPGPLKRLSFVGSATAGIDHIDQTWLEQNEIGFAYSAGCNANSVAEYVVTALLIWSLKTHTELSSLTFGIIGAGHTGSAVRNLLNNLGIDNRSYDPPREERDSDFSSVTLSEVLECDILSFHTPLIMEDPWPTYNWLDINKLMNHQFKLIINTARGGVVNEFELHRAYRRRDVSTYILDVWENEPLFNDQVAFRALIRTPHIAGYSLQAKSRASEMILDSFCSHFDLAQPEHRPGDRLPDPPDIPDELDSSDLVSALCTFHPIADYKKRFDQMIGLSPGEKSRKFQNLRTGYPLRHEFPFIKLRQELLNRFPLLSRLGFGCK